MRFVENNLVQIEGVAKNSFPGRYLIQTGDFLLWNVNTGSGSGDAVQVPSCQYRYVPNGENRMELQIKFAHKEKASGKNVVIHFAYKYSRKS
ncbi:hypothetical protein FLA_4170 [Filimonas lacunae]|nr:hypothetical protein FLA_4170 [Filimonas lacunae]